jgi:hypothetical protein
MGTICLEDLDPLKAKYTQRLFGISCINIVFYDFGISVIQICNESSPQETPGLYPNQFQTWYFERPRSFSLYGAGKL